MHDALLTVLVSNQKLTSAGAIRHTPLVDEPQDVVHTVVIDCSGFTFIDSVGLHVLPAVSRLKLLAYEPITLQSGYDHRGFWVQTLAAFMLETIKLSRHLKRLRRLV